MASFPLFTPSWQSQQNGYRPAFQLPQAPPASAIPAGFVRPMPTPAAAIVPASSQASAVTQPVQAPKGQRAVQPRPPPPVNTVASAAASPPSALNPPPLPAPADALPTPTNIITPQGWRVTVLKPPGPCNCGGKAPPAQATSSQVTLPIPVGQALVPSRPPVHTIMLSPIQQSGQSGATGRILYFSCPHCGGLIQVLTSELNCQIFRHGVLKESGQLMNPHESRIVSERLAAEGKIWGCGKALRYVGECKAEPCDYI